jgi:hypothetical protein
MSTDLLKKEETILNNNNNNNNFTENLKKELSKTMYDSELIKPSYTHHIKAFTKLV